MYILFFFVTTFSNSLYKLFLFYIIDTYWILQNLIMFPNLYMVLSYHDQQILLSTSLIIVYVISSLNVHSSVKLFTNNFGCCFLIVCQIESVRFFLCKSGWWVFLCPSKPTFDWWMSFWYSGYVLISLTTCKYIKESYWKKNIFLMW